MGDGAVSVVSLTHSWAGVSPEEPTERYLGLCQEVVSWRSFAGACSNLADWSHLSVLVGR